MRLFRYRIVSVMQNLSFILCDVFAVCPELFEAVEHSGFIIEDMHDNSAVVKHRPFAFAHTVGMIWLDSVLAHFFLDELRKSLDLLVAFCGANDKKVRHDREVSNVQNGDVNGLMLVKLGADDVFHFNRFHKSSCRKSDGSLVSYLSCAKNVFVYVFRQYDYSIKPAIFQR